MDINRRNLLHTSMLGAGAAVMGVTPSIGADMPDTATNHTHAETTVVANTASAKRFDASNEPQRVRKNFYDLTDAELRSFMKAVGYMRGNYQLRDPRMWENYALTHALHCTEPNPAHQQVHWGWNFLPWHRGYIYFLERMLGNILTTEFGEDGSKFGLPYWDWSTQHAIPNTREREAAGLASPLFGYDLTQEDMTEADDLGFDNTALYDGNRGPSLQKPQMDPANENTPESKSHVAMTRYYMSPEYISQILAAPWDQFGGLPVIDRNTGQGLLEAGPHNCGHDWVGVRIGRNRDMGTLRNAASDPIFFMHHCNIDRIWSLYKGEQPDPTGDWGKPIYHWTDTDGKQVIATAEDIITKFTNITYAPSGTTVLMASRPASTAKFKNHAINKLLDTNVLEIPLPADFPTGVPVLVDIVTGPISYTGKYVVKILAGNMQVGMLNFLDGGYRVDNNDPTATHEFSVLLNLPAGTKAVRLVPPGRGAIKLDIKSMDYRPL